MRRVVLSILALLVVIVGAAVVVLAAGDLLPPGVLGPPELNGSVYPEPRPTPDFTLTTAAETLVSLDDFQGKVVLLYFGYTYCPDVCPTTMADLARVQRDVDAAAEDVQVLMVTVDPGRDAPEVVQDYAADFHPSFLGLSGTDQQIASAADSFGVFYQAEEGSEATGYLVSHTARVFAVDKRGELRASYLLPVAAEEIAADVSVLLRE